MNITLKPGTYVAAVSGGVDSMVLLDLLRQRPGVKVVVAHFDHGIREDSHKDRQLVQSKAREHSLPFVHARGNLGPRASEAAARKARYDFLHQARQASGAAGIITAHHQDDLLETAVLNMLRGSGRRGLTSLRSTDGIIRPLLGYSKDRLRDYAAANKLAWREDSTNEDMRYRRNYVRRLLERLTPGQKAQLIILLEQLAETNDQIDSLLVNILHVQPAVDKISRPWFINLPHSLSREVVHHWLDRVGSKDMNKQQIERLVTAMKTAKSGTRHDIDRNFILKVNGQHLALTARER